MPWHSRLHRWLRHGALLRTNSRYAFRGRSWHDPSVAISILLCSFLASNAQSCHMLSAALGSNVIPCKTWIAQGLTSFGLLSCCSMLFPLSPRQHIILLAIMRLLCLLRHLASFWY